MKVIPLIRGLIYANDDDSQLTHVTSTKTGHLLPPLTIGNRCSEKLHCIPSPRKYVYVYAYVDCGLSFLRLILCRFAYKEGVRSFFWGS